MSRRIRRLAFAAATVMILTVRPTSVAALDPTKRITQYVFDVWRMKDGLPIDTVDSIDQTSDGYLWLSTEEDLVRFDGVRFKTVDLGADGPTSIFALRADSSGALWVATDTGLLRWRNGREALYGRSEGLRAYLTNHLYEDRDHVLWIGTNDGLHRLHDERITAYTTRDGLPHDTIQNIAEGRDGALWVATNGGLARFERGVVTRTYSKKDGLSHDVVLGVHEDRAGAVWISTFGGLSRLAAGRIISYGPEDGVPRVSMERVAEDEDGNIWVPSYGEGLLRFNGSRFERFGRKQGLPNDFLSKAFVDREGSLWIGTRGGGLCRLKDGLITTYGTSEGLPHETIRGVMEDREGAIWIATHGGGIARLDDGVVTTLTTRDGLRNDVVLAMLEERRGDLLVSSFKGGVNRIRNGRVISHEATELPQNQFVAAMLEDRSGGLWLGTYGGGLKRYADGRFITYDTKAGLSSNTVFSLTEATGGNLWIGTRDGLDRLKNGTVTPLTKQHWVTTIYQDAEGTIWAGSLGGLMRVKHDRVTRYTMRDGLPNDTIAGLLEDDDGQLWVCSNKGIFRVPKRELDEFADGVRMQVAPVLYGAGDGMKTAECNGGTQPAAWRAKDGRMWFATANGVVVLDPRRASAASPPPQVLMEDVLVEGAPVDAAGRALTIEPGRRQFEFHYSAATLRAPERVRFRYRIDSVDERWINAGARRTAYYSSLPPGRHRLRVIAANESGVWDEAGAATFAFVVKPSFHQTWWFVGLCAAVATSGIWGGHRIRLRRALEMERVRTRIASDLHDDIGATLSQIAILSEVARAVVPDDTRVAEPLERIARLSRESVDAMGDIVWAIDPHRDTPAHLATRMRRFASELLPRRDIELQFDAGDSAGTHLSADVRREVYLIFKEALHNAVRHGRPARIEVAFRTSPRELELTVRDNGKGFEVASAAEGHGLRSMRRRAGSVGGTVEVVSGEGAGTTVVLKVPVP